MSIVKESLCFRCLLWLWQGFLGLWRGSATGSLIAALGRWLRRVISESLICRWLWRDGVLLRAWPDSLVCRALKALCDLPARVLRWLHRVLGRRWQDSLTARILDALGGNAHIFMGLLLMVMLSAPHSMWNNLYAFLGAAGVLAVFLIGTMQRAEQRLQPEKLGPYMYLYLLFICSGFLGSFFVSLSLRFFFFHLTGFMIVIAMVSSIRSYRELHTVLIIAGFGLALAALYGCWQGYVGVDIVANQQDMDLNRGMPGRVYSFFDNPNNFAEILVMLIPLMLALLLNAKRSRGRLFALAIMAVSAVAIGYTYSRSGWIGLAGAIVLFIAFRNWRLVPILAVLGVLAVPFLPETIYNRILTIGNLNDSSTLYRFNIFDATATLLADHGAAGVGLGNDVMKIIFKLYPAMADGHYPIHTHNNYLQMWAETGIFGLIAYLALIAGQLKSGVKAFVSAVDMRVKNLLAAAIAAMCGVLVISVAEYTWFYPRNMFIFWFLFAVISCCVKLTKVEVK